MQPHDHDPSTEVPGKDPDLTVVNSGVNFEESVATNTPELVATPTADNTKPPSRRRSRTGLAGRLALLGLLAVLAMGYAVLATRSVALPDFLVAEFESRANRAIRKAAPDLALSVESVEIGLVQGHMPRLVAKDLTFLTRDGQPLLNLPEAAVLLDGSALLSGNLAISEVRISAAHLALERLADGTLNLSSQNMAANPVEKPLAGRVRIDDLQRLFDLLAKADDPDGTDAVHAPDSILIEGASASFHDQISDQTLILGDGQVRLMRGPAGFELSVRASLQSSQQPGLAQMTLTGLHDRVAETLRFSGLVTGLQADALAAHVPALGWLQAMKGDLALDFSTTLDPAGPRAAEADLVITKGLLQPRPEATPVAFDTAQIRLAYDRGQGRIRIPEFSVTAPLVNIHGKGQVLMVDALGKTLDHPFQSLPDAFLIQIELDKAEMAAGEMFSQPVILDGGLIEARLRPNPLTLDLGQVRLDRGASHLSVTGRIETAEAGWKSALDLHLDQIAPAEIVALWPLNFLPKTRVWLDTNLSGDRVFNLTGALRLAQGTPGRAALTFDYSGLSLRYLRGMPPMENAAGHATLDGPTLTFFLEQGQANLPEGGPVDLAGTSFSILDLAVFPAPAELRLQATSQLHAMLSLLDQPPFGFITKARLPVDLGQGTVDLQAHITFPLKEKVLMPDLGLQVAGTVSDFASDHVVAGRRLTFPSLAIDVTNQGLTLSGQGALDGVGLDIRFAQGFGPEAKGRATATGKVAISADAMDRLGIGLSKGMVSGQGKADFSLALTPDGPPELTLQTGLRGVGLSVPELAWSKSKDAAGKLSVKASLGPVPVIHQIDLSAAGLTAKGSITLKGAAAGGGLKSARFDRVVVGGWLDAAIEMTGRAKGQSPDIRIAEGRIDLRHLDNSGGFRTSSGAGGYLTLELDELVVTDGISLQGFRGEFKTKGGLGGDFVAALNGRARMQGSVLSQRRGLAVRLTSVDAGAVLAAAGVIKTAIGGALTLTFSPLDKPGHYAGRAEITNIRLRHSSGLSELLNALSIVGLLESLNGAGIAFSNAEADFVLMPGAIDLRAGSAVGGSMGLSMSGLYQSRSGKLDMQGTLSPFYALNSIGAALTRKGEGLFGFNYRLTGTAQDPAVQVNPLSILTPGAFREIFRQPPPKLPDGN